ncbi:MAG: DUF1735 domain-containing protein [Bacteroidales bacterium]|nr:DUF1735 domain-containing protein [Bacteroidales bacterium]
MKLNNIVKIVLAGSALSFLASCHNAEQVFPDYDGGITTYFAYQYPVRTIVLGESETFDTSLDNEGKFIIYGTMGGAYTGKDIVVDIEVDETLTDNLYFDADCTKPVQALPSTYYKPIAGQIDYAGTHMGGVEVELTDAFFADPEAIKTTYVLPVKMTKIVKGAQQILAGTPAVEGETPVRTDASAWKVLPKDYTLYAVQYINKYDGSWLRRGIDKITDVATGEVSTDVRHKQYVENDEVMFLTTQSLNSVTFPMTINVETVVPPPTQYSMSVINGVAGDPWGQQTQYSFATPLKGGTTYVLKCVVKGTVEAEAPIYMNDSDGGQTYGYPAIPITTEWTPVTLEVTPNGNDAATMLINTGGLEGTFWFDDFSLIEKGKTDELIVDGGFATGVRPDAWNGWGSGTPAHIVPEGYSAVELLPTIEVVPVATDLVITFAEDGSCTVSSATDGITAAGTGKFVQDGEKKAWGNKDRDGIYLEYEVDFGAKVYAIKDTLVSRSREVTMETYSPTYKK